MTNWANKGKAALATVNAIPAGYTKVSGGGGGDPITTFYRFTEPTKPSDKAGVLAAGDQIEGTYEGFYEDKRFGGNVYKIKTADGLVALPKAAQLNNAFKGITEGTKVLVVYNGKRAMTGGKYAGKQAHSFDVYAA